MAFVIKSSTLITKKRLRVVPQGVEFYEAQFLGTTRQFGFPEIDLVLMAPDSTLSFQVRNEVFSIPTKPHKVGHQQTIRALLDGIRRSVLSDRFPPQ